MPFLCALNSFAGPQPSRVTRSPIDSSHTDPYPVPASILHSAVHVVDLPCSVQTFVDPACSFLPGLLLHIFFVPSVIEGLLGRLVFCLFKRMILCWNICRMNPIRNSLDGCGMALQAHSIAINDCHDFSPCPWVESYELHILP